MSNQWLRPTPYASPVLFLIAGLAAALFAWNSFNLYHQAVANARLLASFGSLAIMDGALFQLAEIIVRGFFSLAAYLIYQVCEEELMARWRK
jgi:hypothetical protein